MDWEKTFESAILKGLNSYMKTKNIEHEVLESDNELIVNIYKMKSGDVNVANTYGDLLVEYVEVDKTHGRSIFFNPSKARLGDFDVFEDIIPAVKISSSIPSKTGFTSEQVSMDEFKSKLHHWLDQLGLF
jgi:archaellum component FlaF (FlaF/FlaG flagellin family)